MSVMIDGIKKDKEKRFPAERMTIRAAYSGDETIGKVWQEELSAAFPEYSVGLDPLPISISCHTGAGAIGVGLMKDIFPDGTQRQP